MTEAQCIKLPWEVLDACNGFSLDIGGSAMKFLYIDRKQWKEPSQRENGSMGQISLKSFPHEEFHNPEAVELIKKNVHIKRKSGDETPLILGTGVGVSMTGAKLGEQFGVNVQCEEESTCFAQALAYLVKHLPRREVIQAFDPKDQKDLISVGKSVFQTTLQMKGMLNIRTRDEEPVAVDDLWFVKKNYDANLDKPMVAEESMFPFILVMCGSAFGSMLVYEDGTYDLINETSLGGKYWLGMGSLLNNAQTYDELMDVAAKGKSGPVDMAQHDFLAKFSDQEILDDGNMYSDFINNSTINHTRVVFRYGKVNPENKDQMKPEDLTRAFLDGLISDTTALGMNAARITRARHVFFTGGFVSHPLIQKLIYTQWIKFYAEKVGLNKKTMPIEVHFLQASSHLGALGALLRNMNK